MEARLDSGVIQLLVVPAVIIPACGLLVLSTSARLNAIIARVRVMHGERLSAYVEPATNGHAGQVRAMRLEGIDDQTTRMLCRARLMRITLLMLFCAVICLVISSLLLGVSIFFDGVDAVAVIIFVGGLLCVLVAMVSSIIEISRALEAVGFEHDRVTKLCDTCEHGDNNG